MDMLNGSLWNKILLFVLPLAATTILQQLFNAADVAVVGRFVGKEAMAAVGSNSPITGLVVNLFSGVALGSNVVIARQIGQGQEKDISKTVHTSILFSVLSGAAIAGIGELVSGPLLVALGVPGKVFDMALTYLRVFLAGLPALLLYNFQAAIFRSRGDTKTPLLCLVISGIVNVLLNLFFVIVFDMSVAGVALATVISNILSCVILMGFLMRRTDNLKVSLRELAIDGRILAKIIRIGLPAGIQGSMFSIANIIVQSAVNSLGPVVMAASSAAFNIEIMSYYWVNAFGQATTTFIGQNHGAGNIPRCRRIFALSMSMSVASTLAISAVVVAAGPWILSVFNDEPEVIMLGMIRIIAIVGFEALNNLVDAVSGAMRGYGKSLEPAIVSLLGICVLRIVLVYTVFKDNPTFEVLMAVYPISWIATSAMLFIGYFRLMRKLTKGEKKAF